MNPPQPNRVSRAYPRIQANYKYFVSCENKNFDGITHDVSPGGSGFSPTMICRNCELDITLSFVPSPRMIQYVTTILMRKEMYNLKKFVESNLKLQGDIINVSSFWFPSGPEAGFEFPV